MLSTTHPLITTLQSSARDIMKGCRLELGIHVGLVSSFTVWCDCWLASAFRYERLSCFWDLQSCLHLLCFMPAI